jgi:hypothetical protein
MMDLLVMTNLILKIGLKINLNKILKKMKVGFRLNNLTFGGVEVATYDYAFYNEKILQNESVVFYKKESSEEEVIKKFERELQILPYKTLSDIKNYISSENLDVIYSQKSGEDDGYTFSNVKNCNHAVFMVDQPHGEVYAYISEWLSKNMHYGIMPFVPYIIALPGEEGDLRKELGIPKNSIVFGRHGSYKTFDMPWVHKVIEDILSQKKDIYFLFLGTKPFLSHSRIIYLEATSDIYEKVRFINSCDAMLHARYRGETFGLACAEFSICNKPVFTWNGSKERAHLDMLGDKAILYLTPEGLKKKILNFQVDDSQNWDVYSKKFSAENVMKKFKTIFL